MAEQVDHPAHYGGANNPYEAIKVIDAWGLSFCLGNAVKYISRAGKKVMPLERCSPEEQKAGNRVLIAAVEDLKKARWYIDHEIETLSRVLDS